MLCCYPDLTNEDGHVLLMLLQEVVDELANHSQRKILEGEGWAVEKLRHVQAVGQLGDFDDIFQILDWFLSKRGQRVDPLN